MNNHCDTKKFCIKTQTGAKKSASRRECIQQDINRWIPMTNTHRPGWLSEWIIPLYLTDRHI